MKKLLVYIIMFVSLFSMAYSVTSISSCQEINVSGEYILDNNLTNINSTCFIINTDDVTINGNGNSLSCINCNQDFFNMKNSFELNSINNFTLFNISISNFDTGIYFYPLTTNSNFYNIIFSNSYFSMEIYGINNSFNNIYVYNSIFNDSSYGKIFLNGENNSLTNIKMNFSELIFEAENENECNNLFENITDNNNNYVYLYNKNITIDNWNNISKFYLCNADNSEIKNLYTENNPSLEITGEITYLNGTKANATANLISNYIELFFTDNSTFQNITIQNYDIGVNLINSKNNTFRNISLFDNSNGFEFKTNSTSNIVNNSIFDYNKLYIYESDSNIFVNNIFKECDVYCENIYFNVYSFSEKSLNNIFFKNQFLNFVYSNNWSLTPTIFNSTLSGENLGNYWSDFNSCLESEKRGTSYVCLNPNNYTIDSENNIIDYAPLTTYLVKISNPEITINVPVDSSFINITRRSVVFDANFSEEIRNLICINQNNHTINLTKELTNDNTEISTIIPISYGQNILNFTFIDRTGQINSKTIYLNTTFTIAGSTVDDTDGDGLNNSDDKVFGNTSHIFTNVQNFTLKINNTENLSQVFNDTINVVFYRNESKLVEFQNNFTNRTLNLTSLIVKDDRIENKSKVLISGLSLEQNQTKTIYLDLLGNISKYKSLCIKDAEIDDFADISSTCNGTDETYISTIPSTVSKYNISYTDSSNTTVKIEGLTHSGIEQTCTESWSYSSWSTCSSSSQSRTATDANSCGTTFLRDALTQSCSSGGGGGGGGGSSSSSTTTTTQPNTIQTTPSVINVNSNLVKPTLTFTNSFELSIDNSINLEQEFSGVKTIKIKDKSNLESLVEFQYDFTNNNLDLSMASVETGNNGKSYTIVKGISLTETTKKVKLKMLQNTNTICIKDAEVNSINDVSQTCNGENEYLFTCDGNLHSGYSCYKENGYYIVSGLKHSAVLETTPILNTPVEVIPQNTNLNEEEIVEKSLDVAEEKINGDLITNNENSNLLKYSIIGLISIIIIVIILVLVSKRKNVNLNTTQINYTSNDSTYINAKNYIEQYKILYSKEDLIQGLKNAGYPEEIIQKVISEEY